MINMGFQVANDTAISSSYRIIPDIGEIVEDGMENDSTRKKKVWKIIDTQRYGDSLFIKPFNVNTTCNYDRIMDPITNTTDSFAPEESSNYNIIKINYLRNRKLLRPLSVIVERDDGGYIARAVDLPLYGYGDDRLEAIENMKFELDSLYDDLMEDDNFSEEWLNYKQFLNEIIEKA